MTVKNME